MAGRSDRRRRATGFTLIEMTVVLLLLAVILTIVLPNVSTLFGRPAAGGAARLLTDALREARAEAIATRRPVRFSLARDRRSWRYAGRTGGTGGGPVMTLSGAPLAGGPAIVFFPDGSSTGGRVALGDGGAGRAIAVRWLDGGIAAATD